MSRFISSIKSIRKGTLMVLGYKKPLTMRAAFRSQPLYRVWRGTVRPGCNYDELGVVKEMREDGRLPEENAGLPYGEWDEFPYTIKHNGKIQYRFTRTGGRTLSSVIVDAEGNAVDIELAKTMAVKSEFDKPAKPPTVMNVREENITELAGEEV
jgi:hypothetical protein